MYLFSLPISISHSPTIVSGIAYQIKVLAPNHHLRGRFLENPNPSSCLEKWPMEVAHGDRSLECSHTNGPEVSCLRGVGKPEPGNKVLCAVFDDAHGASPLPWSVSNYHIDIAGSRVGEELQTTSSHERVPAGLQHTFGKTPRYVHAIFCREPVTV